MPNNKNDCNFPSLTMLPIIAYVVADALDASKQQLVHLQQAKDKPHLLDDQIINRIITTFTEQNKAIEHEKLMCRHWRQEKLIVEQSKTLDEIETNIMTMEKINYQILFLAEHYKEHTIDKILSMDDSELALAYLSGKLYPP